jgi:hypothetical protein
MKNKDKCDMCGTEINDGKCSCGIWKSPEEMKDCPLKLGLEKFHEMRRFTITGDSPHLGCAVVYFRGDYNDCKKVEKFIYQMKRRPYYEESS